VVNAKEEKVKDVSLYELVIVGSGLQMGKWTGEAEGFLKRFQKELAQKKVSMWGGERSRTKKRNLLCDQCVALFVFFHEDRA
jgi:menaquinone-dependent protoporphyrinogen IX oxidase